MDTFTTIVGLATFLLFPLLFAIGLALIARRWLNPIQFPASRWNVLPVFLLGFALIAILIATVALTFPPWNRPRILSPVVVFLMLDWVLLVPPAAVAVMRG